MVLDRPAVEDKVELALMIVFVGVAVIGYIVYSTSYHPNESHAEEANFKQAYEGEVVKRTLENGKVTCYQFRTSSISGGLSCMPTHEIQDNSQSQGSDSNAK